MVADDRTSLFEKQQLRLRKAIQTHQMHQPSVPTHFIQSLPRGSGSPSTSPFDNSSANSPLSLSALNGQVPSPITARSGYANANAASISASASSPGRPQSSNGSRVHQKAIPPFNNTVRPNYTRTLASVVLPPAPTEKIYDWESRDKDTVKKRLFLDGSSYCPTNQPGMYIREVRETVTENDVDEHGLPVAGYGNVVGIIGTEDLPDKYIDFQIILTAEEMSTLISRRRITSRSDIQLAKSQLVSGNVHISTPYVDPSRVMKDHFRPNHPEKWVSKEDIRPNKN